MSSSVSPNLANALRTAAAAQRASAEVLEALALVAIQAPAVAVEPATDCAEGALLSVKEAAGRLGMSASWVYRAIADGRLLKVRMGSRVRIRVEDLDEFINNRTSL